MTSQWPVVESGCVHSKLSKCYRLYRMSIEIHSPHIVNSLIADAHRHKMLLYPEPSKAQFNKKISLKRTQPLFSSHQATTASKLKVSILI